MTVDEQSSTWTTEPNPLRCDESGPPPLSFAVANVSAEAYAAVPTLRFDVVVTTPAETRVRSLLLNAQIRIDVASRTYADDERARLVELFGSPDRWGGTLRSLLWTQTTIAVAAFEHETTVKMFVPCTYDFDVAASKYLHALSDGEVPLELLFSGSVFYDAAERLQSARLNWESEASCRMPLRVWENLIDLYFPGTAWLRLPREMFDRLYEFKAERGLAQWSDAIDALLNTASLP